MEVVTWNQLGIHNRGVVVLNVDGYWNGLLTWVENSIEAGFVRPNNRGIIVEAKTGDEAVNALKEYQATEGRFKLEWGNH
jgi:predicted Rossmann-fold nucleotide-binding protein